MVKGKYFREYFDIWYESLKIMKYHKDNNEPANEGICFIKVTD